MSSFFVIKDLESPKLILFLLLITLGNCLSAISILCNLVLDMYYLSIGHIEYLGSIVFFKFCHLSGIEISSKFFI